MPANERMCLIDGRKEEEPYDLGFTSMAGVDICKQLDLEYVGYGVISSLNGVVQPGNCRLYFFRYKKKADKEKVDNLEDCMEAHD